METKTFNYYRVAYQTTDGRFFDANYEFIDFEAAYENANGLWNDEATKKENDIEKVYIKKVTTQIEVVTEFV